MFEHFTDVRKLSKRANFVILAFLFFKKYKKCIDKQKYLNYNANKSSIKLKTKASCENSGIDSSDHFVDVNKMLQIGSGAIKSLKQLEKENNKSLRKN